MATLQSVCQVIQAVGSLATAVGVVGGLLVIRRDERRYRGEQRQARDERRQARGDQARQVTVEFDWDEQFEVRCGIKGRRYVTGIVRNVSSRPILDVAFEVPGKDVAFLTDEGPYYDGSNSGKSQAVDAGGRLGAT